MMLTREVRSILLLATAVLAVSLLAAACAKKQVPVARPGPLPPAAAPESARPPTPPEPVTEPLPVPPEPLTAEGDLSAKNLDELNRDSPLKPVFFAYDASDIDAQGRAVLDANAEVLKRYPSWVLTIEGHCDERGTAEYNLSLGERRALAARSYLVSVGISADRLRTVSYGKEFPFDPGHTEEAWATNRRAHFVITAK
jgi:peptidoglycan-associated lipoprotein